MKEWQHKLIAMPCRHGQMGKRKADETLALFQGGWCFRTFRLCDSNSFEKDSRTMRPLKRSSLENSVKRRFPDLQHFIKEHDYKKIAALYLDKLVAIKPDFLNFGIPQCWPRRNLKHLCKPSCVWMRSCLETSWHQRTADAASAITVKLHWWHLNPTFCTPTHVTLPFCCLTEVKAWLGGLL